MPRLHTILYIFLFLTDRSERSSLTSPPPPQLLDELGVRDVPIGERWQGGEVVIKPGKEGTQDKSIPIDVFFKKIVMVRDKLRVLEQKVNGNKKLSNDEKVQLQQYITACYGTLTTFNVLFKEDDDRFVGQKG